MDNLIFNCTDALSQPSKPACTTDYGERVVAFALMKDEDTSNFTVAASDGPTAAEFTIGIASDYVTYITGLSNGHRVKTGSTSLSGDDTITGGTEEYDKQYQVEGRIKLLDETIKRATEKFDRFSTLRMWFFTDKNYCYGGAEGYKCSPSFDEVIHEGQGQPPYIPFTLGYTATGADYAKYDADYDSLTNG